MTIDIIITFLIIIIGLIGIGFLTYIYLRDKNLEELRLEAYQLFLKAEHMYEESGSGKQKLKWVVSEARKLLPKWLHPFITVNTLTTIIDFWFKGVKDLLDDGKINASSK